MFRVVYQARQSRTYRNVTGIMQQKISSQKYPLKLASSFI